MATEIDDATWENNPYDQLRKSVLADPATSNWLKAAVDQLALRDPVDALNDAELLVRLQLARIKEVLR